MPFRRSASGPRACSSAPEDARGEPLRKRHALVPLARVLRALAPNAQRFVRRAPCSKATRRGPLSQASREPASERQVLDRVSDLALRGSRAYAPPSLHASASVHPRGWEHRSPFRATPRRPSRIVLRPLTAHSSHTPRMERRGAGSSELEAACQDVCARGSGSVPGALRAQRITRRKTPPNTVLHPTDQARCVRGGAAHLLRPPATEYHVRRAWRQGGPGPASAIPSIPLARSSRHSCP
jgi:hypothetical protein